MSRVSGCEGGSGWEVEGDEMLKFGESVESLFEETSPFSSSTTSSSFCSFSAEVESSSFGSAAPWSCPAGLGSGAAAPSWLGAVEAGVGLLSCE